MKYVKIYKQLFGFVKLYTDLCTKHLEKAGYMIPLNEDLFYEQIGERIRAARIEAGINQEVFSQLLNLTRGSVVNIEKGRQRPSIHLLVTISNILGVDYIDLIPIELNIARVPKIKKNNVEVNFDDVVSSSIDLNNQKVKTSMNEFLSKLTRP